MITLITGTPGSGKTLYTVDYANRQLRAGRRIVVDGIRDLAIEHELIDESWVRKWFELAQQQDLIVIDEAQRLWPPTPVGAKVGADIEQLHVHRHKGVDFVLITQHPQRISKTVRDLVGRHVHVRRLFGMQRAMLYEWDHCHNISSFKDAVKTVWKYPRDVFRLYTSAEVHTKQKAVVPKALFVLPVALVVAVALGYKALSGVGGASWSSFGKKAGAGPVSPAAASVPGGAAGSAASAVGASGSRVWRVAGRVALDDRAFVVLAGEGGVLRVERGDGFIGEGDRVTGVVDGEKVASWSGAGVGQIKVDK